METYCYGDADKRSNNKSKLYYETIANLKELDRKSNDGHAALANAVSSDSLGAWKKKHEVTQDKKGHICIKRIIGERCNSECTHHILKIEDHSSLWLRKGRPYIYVTQPYHLGTDELKEAMDFSNENEIEMSVSLWPAWHFPTQVFHVQFMRKSDYMELHQGSHGKKD